jgi:hypothetical protein
MFYPTRTAGTKHSAAKPQPNSENSSPQKAQKTQKLLSLFCDLCAFCGGISCSKNKILQICSTKGQGVKAIKALLISILRSFAL